MSLGRELADLSKNAKVKKYTIRCEKGRMKISELLINQKSAIIEAAKKGKNRYTLRWYLREDKDIKAFTNSSQIIDDMNFELFEEELLPGYTLIAKW